MLLDEGNDMQVGIVMGSRSQWTTLQHTAKLLAHLGITYEAHIISANKSSNQLHDYASKAINRGFEIIIAGSTGEARLPVIIASNTEVPVVGMQINASSKNKNICDSKSDINRGNAIWMINSGQDGAVNAALFAASMLANKYPRIHEKLIEYRSDNEHGKDLQKNSRYTA